ncbi:hypothetical protein PCANC_11889 [Puccinia coronata f. sp. avenae]|uniref:Uncharacterized protein n=1 Tax=Puccinia coronata f. sp. avenae TaxID=200324 RepID=A0A2N5V695_9BASI|nr:hypothetical protein PCANC_11889 [Puccinia coronata f. sp. avenae]
MFNSEECDKQEKEQNLAQLYQLQLQEAHSTIHQLEEEVSQLRDGITLQVARLQVQNTQLQKDLSDSRKDYCAVKRELTQQTVKNSNLEKKIELMQLCMDLQPGANLGMMNHHPQPSTSGLNNDVRSGQPYQPSHFWAHPTHPNVNPAAEGGDYTLEYM